MFEIGQIFEGSYPSEAVDWCNNGGIAHIDRIEDGEHDGEVIRRYQIIANPKPTYTDLRLAEYPPVGDQLDMIYHDKVDGTDTWMQAIRRIKDKYPKPAGGN